MRAQALDDKSLAILLAIAEKLKMPRTRRVAEWGATHQVGLVTTVASKLLDTRDRLSRRACHFTQQKQPSSTTSHKIVFPPWEARLSRIAALAPKGQHFKCHAPVNGLRKGMLFVERTGPTFAQCRGVTTTPFRDRRILTAFAYDLLLSRQNMCPPS